MFKMRKLLLLLLFPLTLLSCGANNYYGHYSFQMGSDKSSHFGVFVDLTKEDYYMAEEEGGEEKLMGKKFEFGMRVSEDMVPDFPEPEDPDPDPIGTLEKLFVFMLIDILNVEVENPDDPEDPKGVTGYYSVSEKNFEDKGRKINMNIILNYSGLDVPADIIQKLLIAYINGKTVQIVLPVSVSDFQYQLCWYGMYIDIDLETPNVEIIDFYDPEYDYLLPMPGPQGEERIGSHPTIEDIIAMNEKYGPDAENPDFRIFKKDGWFKDFNTLSVDLLKS